MKTVKLTAVIAGVLLSIPITVNADSPGYKDLKQEFSAYDAPLFYKQNMADYATVPAEKEEIASSELKIKEEELERLKERWNKIIKKAHTDKTFFDFETAKSKNIREIARTDEMKEVLKQGIDLDTLISAAYERNPGLRSAKKIWESTLEKYSQAGRLDDILTQYQSFIKDLNTKVGPMRHKASMSQKFPFPGTLTLKGDIVTKEAEIAMENYLITLRDLITDIKNSYYELIYTGHAVHITDENFALLRQLESVAYIKYKTGQTGYSDVIKVQTRIARIEDDLVTWQEYKYTVIAKLNELLNFSPQFPLGPPADTELRDVRRSLEGLIDTGIDNQQELEIIRLKIDKTNLAIELAEKKFYPDFTLGFSYFEDETGNLVGVGKEKEPFSLKPVSKTRFWFGKNDAYIREARLIYQSLIEALESHKDTLRFSVKDIFFQLDTARRDVLLYRDSLLPLARNNLDVAQTDYEADRGDFLDLLDAQRIWLDYNLLYKKHIRNQNQAVTNLERTVGRRIGEF